MYRQLLKDPRIRFSGYRKPHPLENKVEIKVQTNGECNPAKAVDDAC
jgi:DNA-directed RNA polymerase II subunit RPB11